MGRTIVRRGKSARDRLKELQEAIASHTGDVETYQKEDMGFLQPSWITYTFPVNMFFRIPWCFSVDTEGGA